MRTDPFLLSSLHTTNTTVRQTLNSTHEPPAMFPTRIALELWFPVVEVCGPACGVAVALGVFLATPPTFAPLGLTLDVIAAPLVPLGG